MTKIETFRSLLLCILFLSLPFSIAGGGFAIIGLYLVTAYLLIIRKDNYKVFPLFFWGMAALIVAGIISSLFSENPIESLKYLRTFWRFGLPFVLISTFPKNNYEKYIRITLVVSILISVYSIIQFFTGLDILRPDYLQGEYRHYKTVWQAVGVFSHHLTLGGVFLIIFSLLTGLFFSNEITRRLKYFYLLGALLSLTTAFLTLGRSIWLGLIIVIAVFLSVLISPKYKKILVLVILVMVAISWVAIKRIDTRLLSKTSIGKRAISAVSLEANKDRLMMWKAGIAVIKDHPIIGLGPKMGHQIKPYYLEIAKNEKHQFQHEPGVGLHNIYIQTWVDFGILGLLGLLVMYLSLIQGIRSRINYNNVRKSNENAILLGIVAGLCGNMVSGFFENNFRDGEVQIMIFVAMGLALSILQKMKNNPVEKPPI